MRKCDRPKVSIGKTLTLPLSNPKCFVFFDFIPSSKISSYFTIVLTSYQYPFYIFLFQRLPPALEELKELREFHDPDTVDLMNWIKYVPLMSDCFSFFLIEMVFF